MTFLPLPMPPSARSISAQPLPAQPLPAQPLSLDRSRQLVEAALLMGAAGNDRATIEQALRGKGCPQADVDRLVLQALHFGEETRRSRREESMRAQIRAARQLTGRERNIRRERAWTLSIMAVCAGSVLGAVLWRLAA